MKNFEGEPGGVMGNIAGGRNFDPTIKYNFDAQVKTDIKTDATVKEVSTAKSPFEFTIDPEGWYVSPRGKRLHRTRFSPDWK